MSSPWTSTRLPRPLLGEPPTEFHRFVQEHLSALTTATRVLAGRRGSCLLDRIIGDLATEDHLRPSARRAAEQLSVLLDPRGEEWAALMTMPGIDGLAPELLELELLIEGYREALAQAAPDHPPAARSRQRS